MVTRTQKDTQMVTLEYAKTVHEALHHAAARHLEQVNEITQEEEKLKLQRALIKRPKDVTGVVQDLEQLNEITRQEERLKVQKTLIKANAAAELTKIGPQLKLSSEALAKVTTLMLSEIEWADGEITLHTEFRKVLNENQ
jgi:hypothetical protein